MTTIKVVRRSVATLRSRSTTAPARCEFERGGRLVGQENARIVGERAGDRDPLRLAPGELARHRVLTALDAEIGQQFEHARLRLSGTRAGKNLRWHAQGSGTSLSMLMFAEKVLRRLGGNWTFVIITDRQELDDQISVSGFRPP